jgi:hypothetical protein
MGTHGSFKCDVSLIWPMAHYSHHLSVSGLLFWTTYLGHYSGYLSGPILSHLSGLLICPNYQDYLSVAVPLICINILSQFISTMIPSHLSGPLFCPTYLDHYSVPLIWITYLSHLSVLLFCPTYLDHLSAPLICTTILSHLSVPII